MQPSAEQFSPFDGWSYSLLPGDNLGDGCVASVARLDEFVGPKR